MAGTYDIDAQCAEQVKIRFRGKEWALGPTVLHLLEALDAYKAVAATEKDETRVGMLMVEPVLRALAPGVGEVLDGAPLSAQEQLALTRPLTEVLNQFGSFRPEAG